MTKHKERFLMTNTKRVISAFLVAIMLFTLAIPTFAEEKTTAENAETKVSEFDMADAEKIALTAAKSKMILEGLPNDVASEAIVTKVKYDEDSGSYSATVRTEYKNKYTCKISTNVILGKTIGFIAESDFKQQNIVIGFLGQAFEKLAYFFIKKFN